tara:strand:+ start:2811 stop:4517 length:1707 start_codon:yes stop_codon:yes gene_type:complete
MGNLGKLKIVFEGVDKTKKVFAKLKSGLNSVKNAVGKTLKVFGGLAAGVLALGGSLAFITKKSFDFLDAIGKIATRTGATTDLIQAFQLSAIQSGASIETSNKALQKFAKMVGEGRKGLKTYTDIFDRYNVSLIDATGSERSFNDILLDTMTGMKENANVMLRNADLALLFGRAGQELTNTIMVGGEAFAIFIQKQKELGNIIDGKMITATEQFNDRLSRIGFSFRVLRDSITTAFLPVLDDIAEKFEETLKDINAVELGKKIAASVVDGLINVLKAADEFRMSFATNFLSMSEFVGTLSISLNNLNIAAQSLSIFLTRGLRTEIAQENIRNLTKENENLRASFNQDILPSENIANAVTQLNNLKNTLTATKEAVTELANPETLSDAEKRFREFIAQVQTPLKQFEEGFKTTGAMIGDTMVKSMKKFEDTLVDGLMSGKFEFKDFASFVIKELLRIAVQKLIIDRITGGFTSFFGDMFKASGGTVTGNKPYIVGERGAELFVPNKTGTIVANNQLSTASGGMGQNVHITYNIQSFDSKDTLQAITENAPTISAIIQGEFNKHGRRGFA